MAISIETLLDKLNSRELPIRFYDNESLSFPVPLLDGEQSRIVIFTYSVQLDFPNSIIIPERVFTFRIDSYTEFVETKYDKSELTIQSFPFEKMIHPINIDQLKARRRIIEIMSSYINGTCASADLKEFAELFVSSVSEKLRQVYYTIAPSFFSEINSVIDY